MAFNKNNKYVPVHQFEETLNLSLPCPLRKRERGTDSFLLSLKDTNKKNISVHQSEKKLNSYLILKSTTTEEPEEYSDDDDAYLYAPSSKSEIEEKSSSTTSPTDAEL